MIIKQIKYLSFLIIISHGLNACGQENSRLLLGEDIAKEELTLALSEENQHNVISQEIIIKYGSTLEKIVEPILFEIYGKENISKQKPYEKYLIDNYWVISGTLPQGYTGGTFLLIIDSRNCEIIKITHGK